MDSLINAMEAVRLTLNELDTQRYAKADSILQATRVLFLQRFNDTLAKDRAATLGDQFVQLREANRRGSDHRNVHRSVVDAGLRLKKLRHDVSVSALERHPASCCCRRSAAGRGSDDGPAGAAKQVNLIIRFIEPGTMRVTSRLRLIPGGGYVKVDEDGNEIEGHISALEEKK